MSAGRFAEAIALHEKNLKTREAKLGSDHPETLTSLSNLAIAYHEVGRVAEAIALYEKALGRKEAVLGLDHPNTLTSRNNLAAAYQASGRISDAIPLLEAILKLREGKLGPDHPDTLTSGNNLAATYWLVGRSSEAIQIFEKTLKLFEDKLGSDHTYTLMSLKNLVSAYESMQQWDKAVPLRRSLLERARRSAPSESPELAGALANLGKDLLVQGKPADAEPYLRESLAIREKKLAYDWTRYSDMSLLGGALSGQKKFAEAEPLLIQGYEGIKVRESKIPPQGKINIPEAAARIVSLYEAWEKPEKAAEWREKIKAAAAEEKASADPKPAPK
jgi:tetratricopeptide (TPR) repeat protein